MKTNYDVIIFDWDGTLVDSIDWIVHCLQRAAEDCQVNIPEQQSVRNIIGLSLERSMQKLFPDINAVTKQTLVDCYKTHFFSRQITQDDLFAGVFEMLQDLKQAGFHLAVATGKTRAGLDRAMQATGTKDLFCITRCADESVSKPDPAMLREIILYLDASHDRTLMVGDSIHDLQMAENASISSVAVSCGAHTADVLTQYNPLRCLQNTNELIAFL